MHALVYHGAGRHSWDEVPDPSLQDDTDVIVGIDAVTICGTDLHVLRGDLPEVAPGRVLGHEAVGTVEEVGPAVRQVRPGDRVLVSCISACGSCRACRRARYGQCSGGGGWRLGHTLDGVQAEYARVPFADWSTYRLPRSVDDESAVLLADVLPTAYEVGVLNGHVGPGDVVVVVGAGPIGLATVVTARLFSPGRIVVVDPAAPRRDAAAALGADVVVGDEPDSVQELVASLTDGEGADVVVEAVGAPESFELCTRLVRAGGRVANVGVHGAPASLHLESLWGSDLTITTGLVDTGTIPTLLRLVADGRLDPTSLVTHRFGLTEIGRAYDVFARPAETGAVKVVLSR
ncbi:alcohol dehydrogenase catalytic domain-containing protein [Nocardioides aurantiacus]|uniref:Alcohol dehydrogenase n=1 Tax=Nocardioides aurantiacus TaxID=86796 RepID=A0A3N2CTK3_9ACTN|nr:alcohol dehydrogenase catalytic domain-containing protein [Nocardioides aurantiacus]ROR90845.1 alcohol dehydrogenase [Nocardioides aurantiacus]